MNYSSMVVSDWEFSTLVALGAVVVTIVVLDYLGLLKSEKKN